MAAATVKSDSYLGQYSQKSIVTLLNPVRFSADQH